MQNLGLACVNGLLSDSFVLSRGTHQGWPLSPLLFALAIEPLVARLRLLYSEHALY